MGSTYCCLRRELLVLPLVHAGQWRIDEQGRIWTLRSRGFVGHERRAERQIRTGYLQVRTLLPSGLRVHVAAHRLVWTYLCGEIPLGMMLNHKNGDKVDNRIDNLEVVTSSENHLHRIRILGQRVKGLRGEKHPRAKLTDEDVYTIRLLAQTESRSSIAARYGITSSTMSRIILGQRLTGDWGRCARVSLMGQRGKGLKRCGASAASTTPNLTIPSNAPCGCFTCSTTTISMRKASTVTVATDRPPSAS